MKPVIQTYSGGTINFADPDESVFTVEDIAHGLSNTSRYSGQCKHHYSVATHSVIVAMFLPDELKLEGLLHDGTEASMADIPSRRFSFPIISGSNAVWMPRFAANSGSRRKCHPRSSVSITWFSPSKNRS